MPRLPRFFVPEQPLHVIQRGNNREPIFRAVDDYLFYLACLKKAATKEELRIHAYVLMTNHVHLLVTPNMEQSLSKTMQSVGRRYVQYFNQCYGRTGTLWEGRYKATLIDSEAYLFTCMRYIELNPVRAGMVPRAGDYRWSSYLCNAKGSADAIVERHVYYEALGTSNSERQTAYCDLFREQLKQADVERIREATNKAWALGDEAFKTRMGSLSGRRATPLPRGRRPK